MLSELPEDVFAKIWQCVYDGCVSQMNGMFATRCEWGRLYCDNQFELYHPEKPSYLFNNNNVTMGKGMFMGMRRSPLVLPEIFDDMQGCARLFSPNTHYRSRVQSQVMFMDTDFEF